MDVETEMVYADILRTLQNSILNTSVSFYNFLPFKPRKQYQSTIKCFATAIQILVCLL